MWDTAKSRASQGKFVIIAYIRMKYLNKSQIIILLKQKKIRGKISPVGRKSNN